MCACSAPALEVRRLIEHCTWGAMTVEQRPAADIERLLSSRRYQAASILLDPLYYVISGTASLKSRLVSWSNNISSPALSEAS